MLLLVWLGLSSAPSALGAFQQTHFVIGGGPDPPPSNESYATLHDAGITFLHADSNQVSDGKEMASLCLLHNLSCALPFNSFKSVPTGPGVWGYFIRDEPSVKDFKELAADVAEVRALRPDALSFINLFGWNVYYQSKESYLEYVDSFLSTVKPDVISFDVYPGNTTTWMLHANLELFRNVSLKTGIPFWNYLWLNANGGGNGAGFYRWNLFTAAAYGSRGFMQWCLSPCADKNNCGPKSKWVPYPTLLDKYGHAFPPVFEMARAEHHTWTILGPLMMQMKSHAVLRVEARHSIPTPISGMPLRSLSCFHGCTWTVGHFQKQTNSKELTGSATDIGAIDECVMVVNNDPIRMVFGTLDVGPSALDAVREVNQTTGELERLVDAAPDVFGLQLFFLEGQGRLLCWTNSTMIV